MLYNRDPRSQLYEIDCRIAELEQARNAYYGDRTSLMNIDRDINHLLNEREMLMKELNKDMMLMRRDIYDRPGYGNTGNNNLGNYNSGFNSRLPRYRSYGNNTLNGYNSNNDYVADSAFENTYGNKKPTHTVGVSQFGRKMNQSQQTSSDAREVTKQVCSTELTNILSKYLDDTNIHIDKIIFNINCDNILKSTSEKGSFDKYLTGLINYVCSKKLSLSLEIDSVGTDLDELISTISKVPNGEIYSQYVENYVKDQTINKEGETFTKSETCLTIGKRDFDSLESALMATPNRSIELDMNDDRYGFIDQHLNNSTNKRLVIKSDDFLTNYLFLTKSIKTSKILLTSK